MQSSDIWIGKLDNPAFGTSSLGSVSNGQTDGVVGYEPTNLLAQTIFEREGPSGPNKVCTIRHR